MRSAAHSSTLRHTCSLAPRFPQRWPRYTRLTAAQICIASSFWNGITFTLHSTYGTCKRYNSASLTSHLTHTRLQMHHANPNVSPLQIMRRLQTEFLDPFQACLSQYKVIFLSVPQSHSVKEKERTQDEAFLTFAREIFKMYMETVIFQLRCPMNTLVIIPIFSCMTASYSLWIGLCRGPHNR